MVDSSIELTGGAKQHCHSCCNICRNKQRQDFLSKVKKSYKKEHNLNKEKIFYQKWIKSDEKEHNQKMWKQVDAIKQNGNIVTAAATSAEKNKEYIFYQKWTKSNKSVHNRENVDKSRHNYTTWSKLLHLQKESRNVIDHAFKSKQR